MRNKMKYLILLCTSHVLPNVRIGVEISSFNIVLISPIFFSLDGAFEHSLNLCATIKNIALDRMKKSFSFLFTSLA